jgi:hypothetical protein
MHREQLEEEVKLISDRTQQIITNAVIIGGALALTYVLVSSFSGSKSKSKKKVKAARIKLVQGHDTQEAAAPVSYEPQVPGIASQIGSALAGQATVFLLNLAKEKLSEFLESQALKKSQTNEPS